MSTTKRKRTHKVSRGEHGGGGKTRLAEAERPASIAGGVIARFRPIGSYLLARRGA